MKKTVFLLAIVLLTTVFVGCKKGEEDPALSLLSRKARLTATWNIFDANWSITNYNTWDKSNSFASLLGISDFINRISQDDKNDKESSTYIDNYTYSNGKLTVTSTESYSDGSSHESTYEFDPYELTIKFNNDHTFRLSIYTKYTSTDNYYYTHERWYVYRGIWSFLQKNDNARNKERVLLEIKSQYTKEKRTYDNESDIEEDSTLYTGNGNFYPDRNMYILDLSRLATKELKINLDYKKTEMDGDYYQESGYISFSKQKK